ncbi:MAG: hypothetical protein ACSHUF_00280 [Candidatus Nasuia deltocephalinicola]
MNRYIKSSFSNFLKKKKLIKKFYEKNIVILKILQINKKYIVLDGNLKSECFIKTSEFVENGVLEVKVGDFIEAFLINIENICNRIKISRSKYKRYIFWRKISFFFRKKLFIKGKVLNRIKGGYSISVMNFKCFLPFSCSDKKISNVGYYFNKYLYFCILNFDFLKKNIVLSRKVVISKIIKIKRKIFFKKVKPGFIIKGVIRGFTNYCIFIDIGYLDCLVFYKDLMWGKFRYFGDTIRIGKSIMGIVMKIDKIKHRVFLGVKQIFNPWIKNKKIKSLVKFFKYVRILRLTHNRIYVILSKNLIALTYNKFGFKIFKILKINSYKRIEITSLNFKKKRINFRFNPPLA